MVQKSTYQKKKAQMVADPRRHKKKVVYKYPGAGRRIGSAAGMAIGNALYPGVGGPVGSLIGGVAGKGAHSLVKRITGFGDYTVSKNALVYNRDAVPEFSSNNERCTMIVHREFITDIIGSQAFENREYRINPGIVETFPWLSAVAENYEQYVIQGMVFEYKTTCATAVSSTNTALGTVVMATQYNSLSPPFTSKQQMENYEFAQSSVPSSSILHAIECDPTQTQCGGIFNVSNQLNSGSGDIRLYDIGRFNIATVGMQAAATIGELWVSYKICFLKPKLITSSEVSDAFQQTVPTSIAVTSPFGTYTSLESFSQNSGIVTPISDTEFQVSAGFTGILQCCITYNIGSAVTNFTSGYWTASGGGGTTDVTHNLLGISPSSKVATSLLVSGNDVATIVNYFRFTGGVDTSGSPPIITATDIAILIGSTPYMNSCYIMFNSIDSNFYNL